MDGLTLLRRAQAAGLRVEAVGSELRIRGPKQAEAVVKRQLGVLTHTPLVIKRGCHRRQVQGVKPFDRGGRQHTSPVLRSRSRPAHSRA